MAFLGIDIPDHGHDGHLVAELVCPKEPPISFLAGLSEHRKSGTEAAFGEVGKKMCQSLKSGERECLQRIRKKQQYQTHQQSMHGGMCHNWPPRPAHQLGLEHPRGRKGGKISQKMTKKQRK